MRSPWLAKLQAANDALTSRILARVDISTEDGARYRLRIVTRFSSGATLLKEPRTIEYRLLMLAKTLCKR